VGKNSDAEQEIFGGESFGGLPGAFYGTATEDATGPLDVRLTVDLASADPDAHVTLRRYLIEQL